MGNEHAPISSVTCPSGLNEMVASAIFFLDENGNTLLSRNYRGDIPVSAVEHFPKLLLQSNQGPCINHQGINYLYITWNNVYLLALTKQNSNALSILLFLHHVKDVLCEYFKEFEEESIRDNFVIIYELLDEMMDFGLPQVTDSKILQEYITQESHELDVKSRASNIITNAISWRPEGIYYKKNELFLDVVESFNVLMSSDNTVLKSEILGKVNVNAYLSGMPILKLGLNDTGRVKNNNSNNNGNNSSNNNSSTRKSKTVNIEDVRFHQCVELDQFEHDRTISFIPPDGKFELMSYRIGTVTAKPLFLVYNDMDIRSHSRVIVSVKVKSQFRKRSIGNVVEISIPVPPDADSPRFKARTGTVVYAPESNAIIWKIKQFPGGKELSMKAELQLSSINEQDDDDALKSTYVQNQPIKVKFEIPYLAASGLQVRYLKVTEPKLKYQSLPWVRYLTQSGDDYTIRLPSK